MDQDIFEDLEDLVQPKTYYQSYKFLSENFESISCKRFYYLIESLNLSLSYFVYLEKIKKDNVLYNLQLF